MNKYIKDGKIIEATTRAYNVLYKSQGFIPYDGKHDSSTDDKYIELVKENEELSEQVNNLKSEKEDLSNQVEELSNTVNNLTSEKESLEKELSSIEDKQKKKSSKKGTDENADNENEAHSQETSTTPPTE